MESPLYSSVEGVQAGQSGSELRSSSENPRACSPGFSSTLPCDQAGSPGQIPLCVWPSQPTEEEEYGASSVYL